ncbi:hypothetical protein, partial [Enterococcus faecium]
MRKLALLAALSTLAASHAFAWNETGHMVASAIAYPLLKASVRAEVDRLLQIGGDEKTRDFYGAS